MKATALITYRLGYRATFIQNEWTVWGLPSVEDNSDQDTSSDLPPAVGKVIVPFSWWLEHRNNNEITRRAAHGEIAVWFTGTDDVLAHAAVIKKASAWPLVAVHFPIFTDGRGYSTAALLRERLHWQGNILAIGDVLIDQLRQMSRVGFDQFSLRADQDQTLALKQFSLYSVNLQHAWRDSRSQLIQAAKHDCLEDELQAA